MRRCQITNSWEWTPEALLQRERLASPRLAERLRAVRLVWQGYSGVAAAAILGRSPDVVRRYLHAWNPGVLMR